MFIHQRQQEIIHILLQDKKWHTLEEIAAHAQCAVKTVRRDLHYLKEQLPSDWRIEVIKGKGVKLYKPSHSSQSSIYSFYKREDLQFRVLDQLLRGHVRTMTELADSLYVQVSALYPVFRSVQRYLNHFNLQLHKKPLRIVGTEGHIVYMFYELYFTAYGWEEWPFPNEIDIFPYITQIEQTLDIQLVPGYKQKLAYLLAIAVQRKKQGYQLSILPIYEELIIETPFYYKIKTIPSVLCGVSLSKIDRIFITIAVNCCKFIYLNQNQYKQEILYYFHEGTSAVYQYVRDLVEQLEKEFDLSFQQDEEFLFSLLQYMRHISYRSQFIPKITSSPPEWHEQVKKKHDVTFQKVKQVYTSWIQQHPFLSDVNEADILAITLQVEATCQLASSYRKKVLLYVGDSIVWKRYIQSILYHEFGTRLSIIPKEVFNICEYHLQKLDIDGVITTVPLGKMQTPVLQISVIPTRRELDDIKMFLEATPKGST